MSIDALVASPAHDTSDDPKVDEFGERWGWLMGAIWLMFLIFPINAIWDASVATMWKVAATGLCVVFGVVYAISLAVLSRHLRHGKVADWDFRLRVAPFVVLVAIVLLHIPIIGLGALGFCGYLVAYAMFGFPRKGGLVITGALIASTIVFPLALGVFGDWWFMLLIVGLTAFITFFISTVESRTAENEVVKEQLVMVAERERVARDVHDVLGHSLTVVTVKAELAERMIDLDPERARQELQQIQSLTRQALAEIRATVGGLRVARLGQELESGRDALESAGITADVPTSDAVREVDPRYRIIFAWVMREAITNVVRHSGARSCSVHLTENTLTVIDDGRGAGGLEPGNGLRGVGERVAAAGGTLDISGNGAQPGTQLKVVM